MNGTSQQLLGLPWDICPSALGHLFATQACQSRPTGKISTSLPMQSSLRVNLSTPNLFCGNWIENAPFINHCKVVVGEILKGHVTIKIWSPMVGFHCDIVLAEQAKVWNSSSAASRNSILTHKSSPYGPWVSSGPSYVSA